MMTSCFAYLFVVLAIRCLCIRAERTEVPFPECDTQNCGIMDCIRVSISLSLNDGYSSANVICIDNSSPTSYLLTSCPNGFSSTVQNTSGVCSITTSDNKTDLLLRANELLSGLQEFDCLTGGDSTNPVILSSTSVIIESVPLQEHADDFYGGEDSLIAAVGMEQNGMTFIKFRKQLSTGHCAVIQEAKQCIIMNYWLVLAENFST